MTLFLFQKKIFFAAHKTSGTTFSGKITYDIADINEGAGFNKQTGTFTAPEGGTYMFTFSGLTGGANASTNVRVVYKDDSSHHFISDVQVAETYNNINSIWMMKLSKGEEVYLEVDTGKLWATSGVKVIFTGNLLKLDEWAYPKLSHLQI